MFKIFLVIGFFFSLQAHAFTLSSSSDSFMQGWKDHKVKFRLNPANCPSNIHSLIDRAMVVWNEVPNSDLEVSLAGETTTSYSELTGDTATDVPVIICDASFQSHIGGNGVAGVAIVNNPPAGGHIEYAFLLINVDPSSSGNVNNVGDTIASVVISHEIGHVLGLGHSADINALMYYNGGLKRNLALAQDDIDGVSYLYPRDELGGEIMGCGTVKAGLGPHNSGWLLLLPFALALALRAAMTYRLFWIKRRISN